MEKKQWIKKSEAEWNEEGRLDGGKREEEKMGDKWERKQEGDLGGLEKK